MDKRTFRNFITKRSSIWTLSLCMTGIIVLGGIAAVDNSRREKEQQAESELGELAYLEEDKEDAADVNDTLSEELEEEQAESGSLAEVSGNTVEDPAEEAGADGAGTDGAADGTGMEGTTDGTADGETQSGEAAEASSTGVISEQTLLLEGIDFSDQESLLWPSAGTILIDYSMDGSVYFPTLNQYKYNPALIIGSEAGNQVLAAARGVVESIYVDEVTGTTLVMNIGNGYKLTYGQLKELAVEEGDIVEEGAAIGYVSEPTKYYSKEGSNLYFQMTQNDAAVDPVLYLE